MPKNSDIQQTNKSIKLFRYHSQLYCIDNEYFTEIIALSNYVKSI